MELESKGIAICQYFGHFDIEPRIIETGTGRWHIDAIVIGLYLTGRATTISIGQISIIALLDPLSYAIAANTQLAVTCSIHKRIDVAGNACGKVSAKRAIGDDTGETTGISVEEIIGPFVASTNTACHYPFRSIAGAASSIRAAFLTTVHAGPTRSHVQIEAVVALLTLDADKGVIEGRLLANFAVGEIGNITGYSRLACDACLR